MPCFAEHLRTKVGGWEPNPVASSKLSATWSPGRANEPYLARYGGTPWSGRNTFFGNSPVCQNTSMGMPPRGYQ